VLRIGYLPSDFHPMVLLLGDAADFRALAGALRRFGREPAPVRLDGLGFCAPGAAELLLTPAPRSIGIDRSGRELAWRLCSEDALRFATQLDTLADPALLAGSQMLECGIEDEIPVKASRGEYTEDFLLGPTG
jgi:hypothetical protein